MHIRGYGKLNCASPIFSFSLADFHLCISQFQARSSPPPRATPGHLTPVRLHIVGHLTRIETQPIGHLTRRKNAGQRSRLKKICTPCNMSQLLVVFDKIYVDICELQHIKIFGNMTLHKVWNFQKDVRKAVLACPSSLKLRSPFARRSKLDLLACLGFIT